MVSAPGWNREGIISVVGKLRCQRAVSEELVELPRTKAGKPGSLSSSSTLHESLVTMQLSKGTVPSH